MREMIAKYAGQCRRCNGPIMPGQRIYWHGRKDTEHVSCAESQESRLAALHARRAALRAELTQLDADIAVLELAAPKNA